MPAKPSQILILIVFVLFSCRSNEIPSAFDVSGVENSTISLNGNWKFSINPPEKFWENTVDFSGWPDIRVPGECQMQGFAIKHDTPYVYKLKFMVPKDYSGKQISLNFYGVYGYARVWVNGQFLREHFGGFTKWSCDMTDIVKTGEEAILTVEFIDYTDDISYASGYAKHQIGGILRNVELAVLPSVNFKKLYFETELDENYRNAELKVFYELNQPTASKLQVEIYDAANKRIKQQVKESPERNGMLSIAVSNPLKWDAEHPNLYTVVTTLFSEEKEILKIPRQIGFREVNVQGNKLLVNGMPVKLRGACRHDIHPLLGRMSTPEYDKKDVLLAKEANLNFIRTSHYPPTEEFLRYCDQYGIYVEDETAVCFVGTHRFADYRASGTSQDSAKYTGRYLSQLEEMIQNHRNHPSVIIWSIGNENVFGNNFTESFKWVKANDTTRPVIFSYPGHVPDSLKIYDIASMHYPNWQGNLKQYGITSDKFSYQPMPMLFDEWAHVACYNKTTLQYDPNVRNFWGQSLDSMWTYLFEADGGLGGAIWGMIDETFMLPDTLSGFNQWWGKIDPKIIHTTYVGPCVGYGEWGIVDTWRRKKPEFWGTKKAYSPTKILIKNVANFESGKNLKIPVYNRFDHTVFNELKITWQYGDGSGTIKNSDIKPHQKGELVIPAQDWKAGEMLNLSFYQNDTLLIDQYNLLLGIRKIEIPVCQKGNLIVTDQENRLLVKGINFSLTVDKSSGLLQNIVAGNDTLIKSGPYINLKIMGKNDYLQNWKCTGFKYTVENGILDISTEGNDDNITVSFHFQLDETGTLQVGYKLGNAPEYSGVQECGMKFITGNQFSKLAWDRNSYFSAYPNQDLGEARGEADLTSKPAMSYREYPDHSWSLDSKDFYYHGLNKDLPFTNLARSMKENIYSFVLSTPGQHKITIIDNATQACRFDKIQNNGVLLINDQWDYPCLVWGNYSKKLKLSKEVEGKAVLTIR